LTTLGIRRFEVRYRLPPSAVAERSRLDAALNVVVREALDRSLERLALGEDELVCIQALHVPVRLRLSLSVAGLAEAWAAALAEAIGRAARGERVVGVVHYRSRELILFDFAAGVASGNLGRAWAWRQLGLCRSADPGSPAAKAVELIHALLAEPTVIVPALVHLAELGLLERLLPRIDARAMTALAEAVLRRVGASTLSAPAHMPAPPDPGEGRIGVRWLDSQSGSQKDGLRTGATESELLDDPTARIAAAAGRVLRQSRVAAAARSLAHVGGRSAVALAALASLEVDPGSVSSGGGAGRRVIQAVATELLTARAESREESAPMVTRGGRESTAMPSLSQADVVMSPAAPQRRPQQPPTAAGEPEPAARPRRYGRTRFGGLLFLVGVVEDLDLPREIAARAAQTGRSFRWCLHQLALRLVPAEAIDPAALAFAGLPPTATAPSADAEPADDGEERFLSGLAGRVVLRLRELLKRADQPAPELLDFVCRRRAEIVADPGWIDARFAGEELSTELRGAGLDLDPGYVPWLGVVLKFTYEYEGG
jgi:hypothetical protein